jgi:phosphatidylglycerophosphate synthase
MERPRDLREVCQAGKLSEPGWYAVHRRISIYLTWALLPTRVTPNHVTFLMMGLAAAGALLLASPLLAVNLAGFAVLYLSFLLDKVDGEMARYRGVEAPRAVLLDRFHHLAIEPAVLFAAAYREFARTGGFGVLIAALVAIVIGNIIEEQPHLAPYALIKHLREVGRFPRGSGERTRPRLDAVYPIFRGLKAFRMFITVVPSLLLAYIVQASSGAPLVTVYLFVTVGALTLYLAFQTAWYFDSQLDHEIGSIREHFRTDASDETWVSREDAAGAVVGIRGTAKPRRAREGRTVGPRTVSGAKRHETPSVVRDLTS